MTIADGESRAPTTSDYSDETSTFGDRLTYARETLGLDQSQLAHRLGVRPQTIRHWEEDRSEPRANKLQMLAGMLNVSIGWLMSGQGDSPVVDQPVSEGAAEACLIELRRIRSEHLQLVEKMSRLEKRLRSVVG